MQKSIFPQKYKKVCVLQRRACTQIQNFKRNFLENYNDSEFTVKTKNAPFFMNFLNINVATFFPLKRLNLFYPDLIPKLHCPKLKSHFMLYTFLFDSPRF